MSYFIKDGGIAFSDLEGSFEGVAFKPIGCVFSSYMSPIDMSQIIDGNHSPWFCVKDGRYPVHYITYDSDKTAHLSAYGWNLPIMTCSISSLSGKYCLMGYDPSDSNSYYATYGLPSQVFTYYKKDILVSGDDGEVKMNVGLNHVVNGNGNRLRWSCPTSAFDLYRNCGLATADLSDVNNVFFQRFRKVNFKTYCAELSSYDESGGTVNSVELKDKFDFVNCEPETDNGLFGYEYVKPVSAEFYTEEIPYYRLKVKDMKDLGYTGLKVSMSAFTTFTADFGNTTNRDISTKFLMNANNVYGNDPFDPFCLHFLYEFSEDGLWRKIGFQWDSFCSVRCTTWDGDNGWI